MSKLRRYHTRGNWYFISCVTFQRQKLLVENADLLRTAFSRTQSAAEFDLRAWVILPDHFHLVLATGDTSISSVLQRIKMSFGGQWRLQAGKRNGRAWQHRFWDHIIRDESDLNHHIDYIHYNPVKHGYVTSPFAWPHSTIHDFRREGIYEFDWGVRDVPEFDGEFGE